MKKTVLSLVVLGTALCFVGCSKSEQSDLTKEEKTKMDTLFREGIKNPPSGEAAKEGQPLNAADE